MPKKKIHLFQPQYSVKFANKNQFWLPYSISCLWAYAQKFDDIVQHWCLEKLHHKRVPIKTALAEIEAPDICAFSIYVWNEQYCLELAKQIKQQWPNCITVFGGPQTGIRHTGHDFIDVVVSNEGEQAFVDILHSVHAGQKLANFVKGPRIKDLDYPSPYILGLFDPIIKNRSPDEYFDATLETNRGCPYACTYCDWGTLTASKLYNFDLSRIEQEIDWIAKTACVTTAFIADGNFGIFKERDLAIAEMIHQKFANSAVEYIGLNFPKNSGEHVFQILKAFGPLVRGMTLATQSFNPETLKVVKRDNMKINDFEYMLELSRKYNLPTYTDLILGLPLETKQSWEEGLGQLLEMGQHDYISLSILNILENTEMNRAQIFTYKIKTKKIANAQSYTGTDRSDIVEFIDIVTSTSTMSTPDMIQSYMFAWIMQNFHCQGHSQLLSKFCRNVLGVSYFDFYQHLRTLLQTENCDPALEYQQVELAASELFYKGTLPNSIGLEFWYSKSFEIMHGIKDQCSTLALKAATNFGAVPPGIMNLQQSFLFDSTQSCNKIVQSEYDINSWQNIPCQYAITTNLSVEELKNTNFHFLRRTNNLKNKIEHTGWTPHHNTQESVLHA